MVSGEAPGSCVVTWIVGKSTCGSAATSGHVAHQSATSPRPSSEVAIRRVMKGRDVRASLGVAERSRNACAALPSVFGAAAALALAPAFSQRAFEVCGAPSDFCGGGGAASGCAAFARLHAHVVPFDRRVKPV
jgi:hypothetical protein